MTDAELIKQYLDNGGKITVIKSKHKLPKPATRSVPIPRNFYNPEAVDYTVSLDETRRDYGL